jgi:hypothetical protein
VEKSFVACRYEKVGIYTCGRPREGHYSSQIESPMLDRLEECGKFGYWRGVGSGGLTLHAESGHVFYHAKTSVYIFVSRYICAFRTPTVNIHNLWAMQQSYHTKPPH